MNKCEKCKLEFNNRGSLTRHDIKCNLNDVIIQSIIKDYIENEFTSRQIYKKYGINFLTMRKLFLHYEVNLRNLSKSLLVSKVEKHKHTEKTKKRISEKRKEYLKLNPDKHPWKLNTKFKSHPCELLKSILDKMKIKYISEYSIGSRNYSADISIPEKKIIIEINGNQHYNSNGSLKEYYQKRHNYFTDLGWSVNELHYSVPYSKNIEEIIINIINKENKIYNFDYDSYLKKKLISKSKNICKCGIEILKSSKSCKKCMNKSDKIPNIKNLMEDIKLLGYAGSSRKYKVSPTTIRRWKNKKGID